MSNNLPRNRLAHENVQARKAAFDDFERAGIVLNDEARVHPSQIVAAYNAWADANGRDRMSRVDIREQIARRGWQIYKTKGSDTVRGVGLRDSVAAAIGGAAPRLTLLQVMERMDGMAADVAAIRAAVCPAPPAVE